MDSYMKQASSIKANIMFTDMCTSVQIYTCMHFLNLLNTNWFLPCMHESMLSCFSNIWLSATPWTVAHQDPLSMGFSRQAYCSALPFPTPGHLPNPEIRPTSLASPALAGGFFTTKHQGSPFHSFLWLNNISSCGLEVKWKLLSRVQLFATLWTVALPYFAYPFTTGRKFR